MSLTDAIPGVPSAGPPRHGLIDKALDFVVDHVPVAAEPRMGNNWSYDFCCYRKDERCYYPTALDPAASLAEGQPVWVPRDSGHCHRFKWEMQQPRNCHVALPGPHSGDKNAVEDRTGPPDPDLLRTHPLQASPACLNEAPTLQEMYEALRSTS